MPLFEDPGAPYFTSDGHNFKFADLKIDQAYLYLINKLKKPLWLYNIDNRCDGCPWKRVGEVGEFRSETLNCALGERYSLRDEDLGETIELHNTEGNPCNVDISCGEFGVYKLDQDSCSLLTVKEPVNIYSALIACSVFYLGLALLWMLVTHVYKNGYLTKKVDVYGLHTLGESSSKSASPTAKKRLKSLDTFRGLTIVLMVFVNGGGGGYWFMEHATWNGLQVADLVFPWFIWMMGVCIPIALKSQFKKNIPKWKIARRVGYRSMKLFFIGVILCSVGAGFDTRTFRIMNVLQRFGISYFVVSMLYIIFGKADYQKPKSNLMAMFQDIVVILPEWIAIISIEAIHLSILFFYPVPDCPTGYLGPAGLYDGASVNGSCIGGATGYLDRQIFGDNHIYQWAEAREIYQTDTPHEPEGLIGCMPTIVNTFLGLQAGIILQFHTEWKGRATRWTCWGVLQCLAGGALCLFSTNGGIPLCKNLWSLSFVLVTSGFANLLLAFCFLLIDVMDVWNGSPFFYPGMNSILVYVGHFVSYNLFPFHWVTGPMNTHWDVLTENLWTVSLWCVITYRLFCKKKFYTV